MSRAQLAEARTLATSGDSGIADHQTRIFTSTGALSPVYRLPVLGLAICLLAAAVAMIGKPLVFLFPWWWTAIMHWVTFWHLNYW